MRIIADTPSQMNSQLLKYIAYGIAALLLSVAHLALLDFIAVGSLTPDLLLILVVWIALNEGQFSAIVAGFAIGLFFDIVSIDVIGTNALAKTIVGFIAGYFYREGNAKQIIGSYRFLVIVFICSLVHNLFYFFFYIKPTEISFIPFFVKYGLAVSLYTTVIAIFGMLSKIPRKGI